MEDLKEPPKAKPVLQRKYRLSVGNIPLSTTEAALKAHFETFGTVLKTLMQRIGGEFRGRGMIWFDSEASFQRALKAPEHKFGDAVLKCWVGNLRNQNLKVEPSAVPAANEPKKAVTESVLLPGPVKNSFEMHASAVEEAKVLPVVAGSAIADSGKPTADQSAAIKAKIEILTEQLQEYEDMLDTYVCPISYTLMNDPVTAEDGQTYERENIEGWLRKSDTSPVTRQILVTKTLIPNVKAKQSIAELLTKRGKCMERLTELKKIAGI